MTSRQNSLRAENTCRSDRSASRVLEIEFGFYVLLDGIVFVFDDLTELLIDHESTVRDVRRTDIDGVFANDSFCVQIFDSMHIYRRRKA